MKRVLWCAAWVVALSAGLAAQQGGSLDAVLTRMDRTAANFKTTRADFSWDQYQKVVDETDTQKGTIYFRRQGNGGVQMAADITAPDKKYVLFSDSKVQVYQPAIDRVTVYNAGKNKADFESFLVLGFGGRGHDLEKSFVIRYLGKENAQGMNADKLELVPRSAKVKNMFAKILLWIDPAQGVSVQQQFLEPSGDSRLAKYSNIQLNQKLSDAAFKLNTTGKTETVVANQ
jgi:outer membrane lipoprotein-sorting protein